MKKSKIFLVSFIILCVLVITLRHIGYSDRRVFFQNMAQNSLFSIASALISYFDDYQTFPGNLNLLAQKENLSENDLKDRDLTFWGKLKETPFLYNNRLVVKKKYPPKTIMVAQPFPIHDSRYVLFWFDFTKKTSEYLRPVPIENICKISEKEFQQLQARSNWPIPPAKPEDSKYYER